MTNKISDNQFQIDVDEQFLSFIENNPIPRNEQFIFRLYYLLADFLLINNNQSIRL